MSRIQASNTKPELIVRSFLHKKGLRFRLKNNIPGHPDIYLKKYNAVVFVHGCFWHRHKNCRRATTPKSNTDYWLNKFKSNVDRDKRVFEELQKQGRKVYIIWECQVRSETLLEKLLNDIMSLPISEKQHE